MPYFDTPPLIADVFSVPPPSRKEATYQNLRGEDPAPRVASTSVSPVKRTTAAAPQQQSGGGHSIDSLLDTYEAERSRMSDQYGKLLEEPDYSKMQDYARERSRKGANALMLALAAQHGGEETKPIGAMYLKQAAEARNPMKVASGYIDEDGVYTQDPDAKREIDRKMFENRVNKLDANITSLTAKKESLENQRALRQMAQGMAGGMNDLKRTMLDLSIAEKTAKLAEMGIGPDGKPLGGAGEKNPFPNVANPKATEDERKSTYLVKRITNNAGLMVKGSETPGGAEYAAGKLPVIGEDVAAFARSGPRQQTYQSQLDTIDALLTLATGAAYTKEQLKNAFESYMPTYQDKPDAAAAKTERLRGVVEAAKSRAGRAWTMDAELALRAALPPSAFESGGGKPAAASTAGVVNRPVGSRDKLPNGTVVEKFGPGPNDWRKVTQ
jgi:hypothetical protein